MIKKYPILTGITILSLIFLTLFASVDQVEGWRAFAQDSKEDSDKKDEEKEEVEGLEKKIEELEKKLKETQGKGASLQRDVDSFNSQIQLTELRIRQSQAEIKKREEEIIELAGDIDDLGNRIVKITDSISMQERLLNQRIRERYKSLESSPLVVFLEAKSINNLVQKSEYLEVMEKQDKKLMDQMAKTKKAYGTQKVLFEDKKIKEEELKVQLEAERAKLQQYNVELENKKEEKDALLKQTQNDERRYQDLINAAQRELDQILNAAGVIKDQEPKNVKKGEMIGLQGKTGFATGEHLHFGVYKYSSINQIINWNWYLSNVVDPLKKLKKKSVNWKTGCEKAGTKSVGQGDWEWPMKNITVSQGYGYTCWSPIYYKGRIHPALDMYGRIGEPVYAVADGKAYFCKNCLGDGGNGVFIFHKDGHMSLYWHLR